MLDLFTRGLVQSFLISLACCVLFGFLLGPALIMTFTLTDPNNPEWNWLWLYSIHAFIFVLSMGDS